MEIEFLQFQTQRNATTQKDTHVYHCTFRGLSRVTPIDGLLGFEYISSRRLFPCVLKHTSTLDLQNDVLERCFMFRKCYNYCKCIDLFSITRFVMFIFRRHQQV